MGFALSDLDLNTPAFEDGGAIPTKHTGEGDDVSPRFSWSRVPEGTESFLLFCHDPDAPLIKPPGYGFVHWSIYNIPGSVTELPEGVDDYSCGTNDFDKVGYGGPMPPEGHGTHRYFFWLLALTREPSLESGLSLWEILGKVEPDVAGMNRIVGTYSR